MSQNIPNRTQPLPIVLVFSAFVVALLHCPVFAQHVHRLQFLDDELAARQQNPDLLGVGDVTVLPERRFDT